MRRALAVLIALLTALTLVGSIGGSAAGDQGTDRAKPSKPLRYVALGDSYSAASGVLPIDLKAPLNCLRSTRNYPKVIAKRTGARLTDVTCGAAETGHYFESQYPNVPPQLRALSRRTKLVTMTIGGNDSGVFINAILSCGTLGTLSLGRGSPCKDRYGDSFVRTVRKKTYPDLVRALRAVRKRAPRAEVGIIGYPWIVPAKRGCFPKLPVARGDVPYLRHLQKVLNSSIHRAARKTGATYVDMSRASNGHDACRKSGVRWVEPVVGTTNLVIVHPNALGERKMASRAIRVLGLR